MKKNFSIRLFTFVLVLCMLFLNSCSLFTITAGAVDLSDGVVEDNSNDASLDNGALPEKSYNEGVVLVKYTGNDKNVFANLDIKSVEPLYNGSDWYTLELLDSTKTVEMVQALADLDIFDAVDFDYIMSTDAETENYDVSGNPNYHNNQKRHHDTHKVKDGWDYMNNNGTRPGGSSDVIVAVIDTGVDYNHADLKNNIWINSAEIPDNGIDDDYNGYVDDVYGWDCVGDDNDPMDDNGHGTHVAGIIAAENNGLGGVGVAYNCKVMVIKAGNSSGYFNNSDIAEAIQYAYMNGASVINMSFGGSNISLAVEDALEEAYTSCILVAAAGNDSACNNLACESCEIVGVSYPAALPYVVGVMSVNPDGDSVSGFSNYDHNPYNTIEYEVYAVGSSVYSCWPNNKYATLNGTSMAAPTVAGIAALLRSYYSDREVYSTKYIQSQIVNTGTVNPYNAILKDVDYDHSVVNVYEALTRIPTPEVNLYDYYIDDSESISAKNNGNGVIDAGETVRLYVSLHNRGGVASNVNVSIDTMRNNDPSLTDPYFTFVNSTIKLSDIGTYSARESGDKYFEIIVDADCPNDYLVDFNICFTYENGLNDKDNTVYNGSGKAQFNVSSGYHLPSVINEDIVFTNDRRYIVAEDVVIPEGVTVTFEEGCEIQFYDDRDYLNFPSIIVYGTLKFVGTMDNMIAIAASEIHSQSACVIECREGATLLFNYANAVNLQIDGEGGAGDRTGECHITNSTINGTIANEPTVAATHISNCYIFNTFVHASEITNNFIVNLGINIFSYGDFSNNIVCSSTNAGMDFMGMVKNNFFYSTNDKDPSKLSTLYFYEDCGDWFEIGGANVDNNSFSFGYQKYASQLIVEYYDSTGNPIVDVYDACSDISLLWPHVVSVEMFDKTGEPITTVGKEEIKVRVTFNRAMDTTQNTFLTFGTIDPYADCRIDGEYISDTVWEGNYTLKAQIENGQNYLKVNNACAAEDSTKTVFGEYQLHEFTIDTTAAMSMSIIANPTAKGIELTWAQDDYDTLMGYNVYRSNSKDGNFVKINPAIVLDDAATFIDTNAEAGKTYWYTFTTVLSDFTESNPAGIVSATAIDSIPPTITHTPVTQGYLNQNLAISCSVTDNIKVASVTLYYRTVGETEWHKLTMSKASNQYRATIYGSSLSLDGLEYYIVASDGVGERFVGDEYNPICVAIRNANCSHSFAGDLFSNEEGHWQVCSDCRAQGTIQPHTPGAAPTQTTHQTCTECGYVINPALGHTHDYGTDYIINEYQHWYECSCGKKSNVGNHVFDNACDTDCNKCGITRTTEHSFDQGVITKEPTTTEKGQKTYTCTKCGEKRYEDVDMLLDNSGDGIEKDHSECEENANGWDKFWNAIFNFFRTLFGLPPICVCGDEI